MPSHYTLRMQFGPHQDPELVKERLLELVKAATVDEIMFFFFAEEQNDGHEPLERIKLWIETSRPYRKALASAGVAISLNPWHTLLHGDRGRRLKPGQNWQTMVDPKGRAATAQVCPLDAGWRKYYEDTLRLYAAEGFRAIWIDDDIRLHNHPPLEWGGCFCPLHVREFNRRAGAKATREEIVANCTAPGKPHPWREIWMDMNEDTYFEMISRWRGIVEEGGARLGLMSSQPEAHGAEGRKWARWWRAFSGGKPPVHRPHFWPYTETTGDNLTNSIALLDQNRCVQPEQVESGPELDNGPYGPWNKSLRQTFAAMALAHIMGSTNLNVSLYDFLGNDPRDEPERPEFLRLRRPTLDWLADEFPMTLHPAGIGVPWNEDMGRNVRTGAGGKWSSLECPTRGWARWLGAAGIAFAMRPSTSVNALGGPIVWSFSDAELKKWLSKGVLLDGPAAAILVERGFGEFIGFASGRFVTLNDAVYSIEHCTDESFALRAGAEMPLNAHSYAAALFQGELVRGARVASDLRSPTQAVLGHGLVVFDNSLGGRVATVPWIANGKPPAVEATSGGVPMAPTEVLMSTQRAAQLLKVAQYLSAGKSVARAAGGAWLIPQFLTDGKTWRGVVWNASSDEVNEIRVNLPDDMPPVTCAVQVDSRGMRYDVRVKQDGRVVLLLLPRPLHQWELVVLR